MLPPDGKGLVQYQHDPPLETRPVNDSGTDWIPPQHDQAYLYAELTECHRRETYDGRSGATVVGSDRHAIDHLRRLRGELKPKSKRVWPAQRMKSASRFPPKGSQKFPKKKPRR